jgi:hypothetical protein
VSFLGFNFAIHSPSKAVSISAFPHEPSSWTGHGGDSLFVRQRGLASWLSGSRNVVTRSTTAELLHSTRFVELTAFGESWMTRLRG